MGQKLMAERQLWRFLWNPQPCSAHQRSQRRAKQEYLPAWMRLRGRFSMCGEASICAWLLFVPWGCPAVAQVHVIKHPARSDAKPGLAEATAGSSPSEHQGTRGGAQRYLNPYPGPSGRRRLEPQNTVEESLVLSFEYIVFDQLETAG